MWLRALLVLQKFEIKIDVFLRFILLPLDKLKPIWDVGFSQSVPRRSPEYVDLVDW
jgi:hypothetical protein